MYETARFKKADLDGNGLHTMKEFIYGRMKHFRELDELLQDPEANARRQMIRLDLNVDGFIDPGELEEGHGNLLFFTHPSHLWDLLKEEL